MHQVTFFRDGASMNFVSDLGRKFVVLCMVPFVYAVAKLLSPAPVERPGYRLRGRPTAMEPVRTSGISGTRVVEQYTAEMLTIPFGDPDDNEDHAMKRRDVQVGDILIGIRTGWKRGPKDLLIQTLTRGAASHVGVMGEGEVYEAVGSGIERSKLASFIGAYSYVAVIRPFGVGELIQSKLSRNLPTYSGRYNYSSAIKTSVRTLERDVKRVARERIVDTATTTYICSDFVRQVFLDVGLPDLGVEGRVSTPSDFANERVGKLAGYLTTIEFHAHDTSRNLSNVDDDVIHEDIEQLGLL